MIPIQCPKCGRTGNVPPDRLNARLVCKGCQSAFHMDNGGRMVLGEPGSPAKGSRPRVAAPTVDFDLAQTWQDVPRPAKIGVPAVVLLLAGWMYFPAGSSVAYQANAEAIGRALLKGDRSTVVAMATPESADAAGKWYDLMHEPIAQTGPGTVGAGSVQASLISGNGDQDSSLNVGLILATDTITKGFGIQLVKTDGRWKLDGTKSLDEFERANAAIRLAAKKK